MNTAPKSCCGHPPHDTPHTPGNTHAKDPVCGMDVQIERAKHVSEHDGNTHYFCSAGCKGKFDGDPDRYLQPRPATTTQKGDTRTFTCPMLAAGAMSLSSVSVVANALRLRTTKL